jgi:hypothetical protein
MMRDAMDPAGGVTPQIPVGRAGRTRYLGLLTSVIVLGLICATDLASGAEVGRPFGKSSPSEPGHAHAIGTAWNPRGISVKVDTDPGLSFSITYSIECFLKSKTSPRFRDGGVNITGPSIVPIRQTHKRARKCVVSASAAPFSNAGPIQLQLLARHRKTPG